MEIKFLDLSAVNERYYPEFARRCREMFLKSGFIGSQECEEFERDFAAFLGIDFCIGVGNGTDALEIAIKALNLPKGSQIILPNNTFVADAEAILNMGYKAVLIDCDESYNISPKAILSALTPQTSALLVVHLYGRMCEMNAIIKIAEDHNLLVIEDCSQAHGAKIRFKGAMQYAGTIGDIGTYSFYPSKNLGAIGDAGCVVTKNASTAKRVRSIANHHSGGCDKLHFVGRNSRLDALQAMFLSLKLKDLPAHNLHRKQMALLYHETLEGIEGIVRPELSNADLNCVWYVYCIRLIGALSGRREVLQKFLSLRGVQTHTHYPQALSKIPEIKSHINVIVHSTPNANNWDKDILSLPIGLHVGEKEVKYICDLIREFSAMRH